MKKITENNDFPPRGGLSLRIGGGRGLPCWQSPRFSRRRLTLESAMLAATAPPPSPYQQPRISESCWGGGVEGIAPSHFLKDLLEKTIEEEIGHTLVVRAGVHRDCRLPSRGLLAPSTGLLAPSRELVAPSTALLAPSSRLVTPSTGRCS